MKGKSVPILAFLLIFLLFASVALASVASTEQEPNNTPAQANSLYRYSPMQGAIDPAGDVDYFLTGKGNTQWGFVAFLDSSNSTSSQQGVLSAYAPDGTTLLQQDEGAPGKQALVAWQHFASGNEKHYLRVNEKEDDQTISQYSLRYYLVPIGEKPEQEPNNTPATANVTSKTNIGAVANATDVDCYDFYAKADEKFLFVLNADPEGDGGPADFALDLYRSDSTLWVSANRAGAGGNEYIDEVTIPAAGEYTYCVRAVSGAGANATYLSGPMRDGTYYLPHVWISPHWDNPRPGGFARVGDEMRYTMTFEYAGSLTLPGPLHVYVDFKPACQSVVDADSPDEQRAGWLGWDYGEVSPNMTITKTITLRAEAPCARFLSFGASIPYYGTSWGQQDHYIIGDGYYLPLVLK
jgi:hypothetical protein